MISNRTRIEELAAAGAIFYVSHSGGKDSQAMYLAMCKAVPHDQICVVHADLGRVEWDGVQEHIRETTTHKTNVVRAGKDLLGMVKHRHQTRPDGPSWPSSKTRQCTSDLKRDPIHKFIRQDMKARGATIGINAIGLRAQESPSRRKKEPLTKNKRLCTKSRTVYDYLPIHHFTEKHVFNLIANEGQTPFWAYDRNERLSCVFCIMGSDNDLKHGAEQRPDLYQEYLALERETGWTMFNGASLKDRVER